MFKRVDEKLLESTGGDSLSCSSRLFTPNGNIESWPRIALHIYEDHGKIKIVCQYKECLKRNWINCDIPRELIVELIEMLKDIKI